MKLQPTPDTAPTHCPLCHGELRDGICSTHGTPDEWAEAAADAEGERMREKYDL